MAFLTACGGGEAPSCSQAFTAYYSNGCAFVDLQTNQPVPKNTVIADCQSELRNIPSACKGEFDGFLICIEGSSASENQCDCTSESDDYLSCL